jgi:hypothetical protein
MSPASGLPMVTGLPLCWISCTERPLRVSRTGETSVMLPTLAAVAPGSGAMASTRQSCRAESSMLIWWVPAVTCWTMLRIVTGSLSRTLAAAVSDAGRALCS